MAVISRKTSVVLFNVGARIDRERKMTLSIVQQHLFSYFCLTNVSSLKSSLEILEQIMTKLGFNETPTLEKLSQEILHMNKTIQKYDLEIVETVDELTCEKLFILVNTADNVIAQKSKFYDENTSQLFSKIVKDCVLSDEGNLSETHCLNLSSQIKMTKSAAQSVLEKLVADKWLVSVNNKISLGMRSIAELQQNIKQHYPDDVKNCPFCKLIVVQGYVCGNCRIKCHFACLKRYFILSKSKCVCPSCKETWNDVESYVNVEVPPEAQEQEEEDPSVNVGPPKKRKKKLIAD